MRLVDTESSRILASFSEERQAEGDVAEVCRRLATNIVRRTVLARPLQAQADQEADGRLKAGIGSFHGAGPDMRFDVVERLAGDASRLEPFREKVVGSAQISALGEMESQFDVKWNEAAGSKPRQVWIHEAVTL